MSRNYKMTITYDGTAYCGWQVQKNGRAIQDVVQKCLSTALREETGITGSGRTDTGVHAIGQVAHFLFKDPVDTYRLLGALNGLLPPDIRVKEIIEVPTHFHARYSAIGKTYHYHLHLDPVLDPFRRLYCLHFKQKIDIELLKEAAKLFLGTHDFSAFANKNHSGAASKNAVRTIQRLDVIKQQGGYRLEFEANGFLYKMVRTITGTLLDVASGRKHIEEIPMIFEMKNRRLAGKAAPPEGLYLAKVDYGEDSQSFLGGSPLLK